MRRAHRRILRVGLLSLMLGVLTTYLVAWWLLNQPVGPNPSKPVNVPATVDLSSVGWIVTVREKWGFTQVISGAGLKDERGIQLSIVSPRLIDSESEALPVWSVVRGRSPDEVRKLLPGTVACDVVLERAAGWPRLAVVDRTCCAGTPMRQSPMVGYDLSFRRWTGKNPLARWTIAFMPVGGGFAVDAAGYGAVWAGVIWGVGAARRWGRGRRGLCRECRYDLKGLVGGVCPECGAAAA